ncbi:MAG: hypothetical protein AAFV43_05940 [Planctomycetota bacterium]
MTPKELIAELDAAGRSQSRRAWTASLANAAAVIVAAGIALAAIDFAVRSRDAGLRWIATAVLLTVAGYAVRRGWRELRGRLSGRLAVAEQLEAGNPELGSRLSSAVAFYGQESDDPAAGSAELRRAVVVDAANRLDATRIRGVVAGERSRRSVARLAVGVAVVVGAAILSPTSARTAATRLLAPWSSAEWPRRTQLIIEAPEAIATGGDFEALVSNRRGLTPDDTTLYYRFVDDESAATPQPAPIDSLSVQSVGDEAIGRLERVTRDFEYRIEGGDDDTMTWRRVAVLQAPEVRSLAVAIAPPNYSGLPQGESTGQLRVLAGSELTASIEATEPLDSAVLRYEEQSIDLVIDPQNATVAETPEAGWRTEPVVARYRLELRSQTGVEASTPALPYEVIADTPPTLDWFEAGDAYATPTAVVPVRLRVRDDLAVAGVGLTWRDEAETGATDAGPTREPRRTPLFEGPSKPPARESLDGADRRVVDHAWDLASLGLAPGARLTIAASASDYLPQTSSSERPTGLLIVSPADFEARLAEEQSMLVQQITESLERQRAARDATESLAIEAQSPEVDTADLREGVRSAEYTQRLAQESVADPTAGAARLASDLRDRAERNRLDRPELVERLAAAATRLTRLAESPIAQSRQALAAARRAAGAEREAAAAEAADQLNTAVANQERAIEGLATLADELAGWADYGRFAKELLDLAESQRIAQEETVQQAAKAAQRDPLGGLERETAREQLLATQAELRRRFARLRQAMQGLLDRAGDAGDEQAGSEATERAIDAVRDTLAEGATQGVGAAFREAASDLARGRFASAAAGQERAIDGLEEMLQTLRGAGVGDPERLIAGLREAQQRIAELQQRAADPREAGEVANDAERMSRKLDRLTAPQAGAQMASAASQARAANPGSDGGQSGQSGGQSGQPGEQSGQQQGGQRAGSQQQGGSSSESSPQENLADAQQSMQQAQRAIDERIEQIEEAVTQRLLDRLAAAMPEYIERQDVLLSDTAGADLEPSSAEPTALARDQLRLRGDVASSAEGLTRRPVFELALISVAGDMDDIVTLLERGEIGRRTQRREAAALRRLKAIAEVLEQNQQQAAEQEQSGGGGGGGGGGQPSPVDVAELKMLRLTQLDLIGRTDLYEADAARSRRDPGVAAPPAGAGRRLAVEQRRLAELAGEMARRKNDPEEASDEL